MLRFLVFLTCGFTAAAQQNVTLSQRVEQIVNRSEYKHSRFGVEFYSLDTNETIFQLNGQQFFTPASTAKLLTTGTALAVLGSDYRFRTRVYRAGSLHSGTLTGDLILVASGDPNLSNRIRPDHTLEFKSEDHSYGGNAVPGDPLAVLRTITRQIASKGIHKIIGRVLVDVSLFPEGTREVGTSTVISPISLNDNIIDVSVTPGAEGAPAKLDVSPKTGYLQVVNQTKTIAAGGEMTFHWIHDARNSDGSHTVTVTGNVPSGKTTVLEAYRVPEPSVFAAMALSQTLRDEGIAVQSQPLSAPPEFKPLSASYTDGNLVAEHVSLPLSEAVRVILKVSQNLHASMMPYVLGATIGSKTETADQAGFDLERTWLDKAALDTASVAQGAGLSGYGVTPDFMVRYLAYVYRQEYHSAFRNALPILGKDGSLWNIQVNSPAAGHIFAKTGTGSYRNLLGRNLIVGAKGLAGYIETKSGQNLAFAIYVGYVPGNPETIEHIVADALGEMAAAAYDAPLK